MDHAIAQPPRTPAPDAERLLRCAADALDTRLAVLNADGTILAVNRAWREFAAASGFAMERAGVGVSYLEVCDRAKGRFAEGADRMAAGIRGVLAGDRTLFYHEYPCPDPNGGPRWFSARVTRFDDEGARRAVVEHEDITQRWLAERSLREANGALRETHASLRTSEALFHTAVDSFPGAVVIYDAQRRMQFLNAKGLEMSGRAQADLKGRRDEDLFPPEVIRTYLPALERAIATRQMQTAECAVPLDDGGGVFAFVVTYVPLLDDAGAVDQVLGVTHDITERRRAEIALRDAYASLRDREELFRQLAEHVQEVFWITDPQKTRTIYVSPAYETVWGRSCASLYEDPRSFLQSVHPDDRAAVLARQPMQSDGPLTQLYRLLVKGGEVRWIRLRTTPVRDEQGNVYRIAGIAEDITDLKRTEEQLARLARIVESSNDAIIGATVAGEVTSWNEAAQRVFGYDADAVLGRNLNVLIPPECARELAPLLERLRRGETVERREATLLRKDGTRIEVSLTIFPLRDAAGRPAGISAIAHDITERRRLERELLEVAARERQRIGQDLHDDICQRLTAISCLARLLQQRLEQRGATESAAAQQIVQLIQQATQQTRDVAKRLYVEELEEGGLPQALRDLAASTEDVFGVRCFTEADGRAEVDDPPVATHLYRIAQEAVANAVKHAGASRVRVILSAADEDAPGGALLVIEDDGRGIPDPPPRQGLGLQIMHQRARVIGATLDVGPAADGRGTRVTCRLPEQEGAVVAERTHASDERSGKAVAEATASLPARAPTGAENGTKPRRTL